MEKNKRHYLPHWGVVPRQREAPQEETMTSVHDVAAYILEKLGSMSTMKLQKLCYYSQAWSLAWDEKALFEQRIEAWANGPVAPALYRQHRGQFSIGREELQTGDASALTKEQRDTVDAVLEHYGALSGRQLSYLTHAESPWRDARGGLPQTARSEEVITPAAMAEYYAAVDAAEDATEVDDFDWSSWEHSDDYGPGGDAPRMPAQAWTQESQPEQRSGH